MRGAEKVATLAYRACLLLLPRAFRRAYARDMVQMFEDRQRRARTPDGHIPAREHLGLWLREIIAVMATTLRVRFGRRQPSGSPSPISRNRGPGARKGLDVDSLVVDLKAAFRALRAGRASAALAVVALGLGIGANAAIFSVVYGVLQPLPYPGGERLALVYEDRVGDRSRQMPLSSAEYLALEADDSVFEDLAAYQYTSTALLEGDPYSQMISGVQLSHDFMDLLGSSPFQGRDFTEADDAEDALVVVGYALWQKRWGGDPELVGSTITIDGSPHAVIGITAPDFTYFNDTNRIYTLLSFSPAQASSNAQHVVLVLGRLRSDLTAEQLDERVVSVVGGAQALDDHVADEQRSPYIFSLYDAWVGAVRQPLLLLMGSVCVLALIACANVASLEIARGLARQREIALRLALGARMRRVVRQLLAESIMLALAGGAMGVALAWLSMSSIRALIATNLPRADNISLDLRVFGFALVLSVVSGVLAGLAPAWVVGRQALVDPIKEGGSTVVGGPRAIALRKSFLVTQMALAIVLTVGAGLLWRSVGNIRAIDLGFDARDVSIGGLLLRRAEYRQPETRFEIIENIASRIAQRPEVESVGVTNYPPGVGFMLNEHFELAEADDAAPVTAVLRVADEGLFDVLRIAPLRGRVFRDEEIRSGPSEVALVNDAFAREHWSLDDAVGKKLRVAGAQPDTWITVVGVVPATKPVVFLPESPEVFLPWGTNAFGGQPWLAVRSAAEPEIVTEWAREALRELDRLLPVPTLGSLDELVSNTFARQRLQSILLASLAIIALMLTVVGEYAVIQYVVRQRTAEIGIRKALGARNLVVVGMIVRQGLAVAAAGATIGLGVSWAASRLMEGMLFGIEATDLLTYAATAGFLVVVTIVASIVPAWRAGRIDPVIALRSR